MAADAELDSLKDAVEREIVAGQQLIGRWGPLIQQLCHDRSAFCLSTLQIMKHRQSWRPRESLLMNFCMLLTIASRALPSRILYTHWVNIAH